MVKFKVYKDKKNEYRWRLIASNGKIIADCAEGYKRLSACNSNILKLISKLTLAHYKIEQP